MSNLDDIIVRGRTVHEAVNRTKPEPLQVEIISRSDPATFITEALVTLTQAWMLMVCLGALSRRYPVPAPSYTDSVLALLVLGIIGYGLRRTHRVWTKERKK